MNQPVNNSSLYANETDVVDGETSYETLQLGDIQPNVNTEGTYDMLTSN